MLMALSHARPDELPGILADMLKATNYPRPLDPARFLAPCGRVRMLLNGVLHLVPLPPR